MTITSIMFHHSPSGFEWLLTMLQTLLSPSRKRVQYYHASERIHSNSDLPQNYSRQTLHYHTSSKTFCHFQLHRVRILLNVWGFYDLEAIANSEQQTFRRFPEPRGRWRPEQCPSGFSLRERSRIARSEEPHFRQTLIDRLEAYLGVI